MINWTSSKLDILLFKKHNLKNEKASHKLGENILNTYIWQRTVSRLYIKNPYDSVMKQTNKTLSLKMGKKIWTDMSQKKINNQ